MKSVGLVLLVLLLMVVAVALVIPLQGGQVSVQVVLPAGAEQAERGDRLVTLARTIDWGAFLAAHGVDLEPAILEKSLTPLISGGLTSGGLVRINGRVEGHLTYQITGRDGLTTRSAWWTDVVELVEHRLQMQAWMDAFPCVDAGERRALAWRLISGGLGEVVLPFLETAAATEQDPALKAYLLELRTKLASAEAEQE